jgi:hypothetical protein
MNDAEMEVRIEAAMAKFAAATDELKMVGWYTSAISLFDDLIETATEQNRLDTAQWIEDVKAEYLEQFTPVLHATTV